MLALSEISKLSGKKDKTRITTMGDIKIDWIDFLDPKSGFPCLPLEYLWGCRGMVRGRMLKIEAEEGIGKSAYLTMLYGIAQRAAANCLHFEAENAIAPRDFLASFGCNPDQVLNVDLDVKSIEACFNEIDLRTEQIHKLDPHSPLMAGVDSVSAFGAGDAATDAAQDVNASSGGGGLGLHARFLSRWFRDRWTAAARRGIFLAVIAQVREKINTTGMGNNKPQKTTIAERPLNFYSSFRLELTSQKLRDSSGVDIGEIVRMKTTKNKLSRKGKRIEVPLIWDHGFDMDTALLEMLVSLTKNGPIKLPDGRLFEISRTGGWIKCPLVCDKNIRTSEVKQFSALFYSNTELLMAMREALCIRGFGFKFETDLEFGNHAMSPVNDPEEDEGDLDVEPATA